jgi:hypothetical protein
VLTYANSHVQVIHYSASPTVHVYIDGTLAVEDFMYRTATPALELGTSFTVGIAPADGEIIAEFPFNLMDGGEYVVVATGLLGNENTPFDLAATATTFGADNGYVGLEVYHGSTDAPAIDVLANSSVLIQNLSYGEFSGYVQVPAADYTIGIAPTGTESIADFVAPLSGLGGGSAVRNSGAAAVVEGLGAQGCEYMTRGTVIILGKIGSNFGAGMTDGIAFIYTKSANNLQNLNTDYVRQDDLLETDFNLVWKMIRGHQFHTASLIATSILNNWENEKNRFVKIIPKALDIIDFEKITMNSLTIKWEYY